MLKTLRNSLEKMKVIFVGKEGSGKTLLLGREADRIVKKNVKLYKKTGVMRPIITNIAHSDSFYEFARANGVPIKGWQHIADLEHMTECDLFIDEVAAYFDSRTFADLPLSTRLWLAQAQKLGVHIYGGAQDWAQIDVSFRRLVTYLYEVKKVMGSRRPSKSIPGGRFRWAVGLQWRLNPLADADLGNRSMSLLPSLIVMTARDMNRFDTNARVLNSEPPPLRKIVRVCHEDGYKRTRYV